MKTATAAMQAHIAGDVTTLATCAQITRRDGVVYRFTDHDQDLVIDSSTFTEAYSGPPINGTYQSALSYTRSSLRANSDGSVGDTEVEGIIDSTAISGDDLRKGLFDSAAVLLFLVNWADLTMGIIALTPSGWIGQVKPRQSRYVGELRGKLAKLQNNVVKLCSPICRTSFGSTLCGVDLGPLTETGTVTAVTDRRRFAVSGLTGAGPSTVTYVSSQIVFKPPIFLYDYSNGLHSAGFSDGDTIDISGSLNNDGTYIFEHIAAGSPDLATVQANFNPELAGATITFRRFKPGYYQQGRLTWLTGANAGQQIEVRSWSPPNLELPLPAPFDIQIGDTFHVTAGCPKDLPSCVRFGGKFRGEPFVPGPNRAYDYPNAQ